MERRICVSSAAGQLPVLMQFVRDFWATASLPPAKESSFALALEEVFMNVVMHGSPPGTAPTVEVSLGLADGQIAMTVEDDGPPFDPLMLPQPDVEAGIEERRIGGLGVFLVRQLMDTLDYRRVGARNQLRMTQRVESGQGAGEEAPLAH